MKLEFRQRLLATTLLVGASLVATPAFAQDPGPLPGQEPGDPGPPGGVEPGGGEPLPPPAPDASGTPVEPDTSAVTTIPETIAPVEGTPVPSTSAQGEEVERRQDIIVTGSRIPQPNLESASPVTVVTAQEVKLSGTTRTEDLINSLPQVFAAQGSNISNGASGTATVSLRGIGTTRTLVLVNGKRLMGGDPFNPVADLNFIPNALIKRVDVLTGGASSTYGADAVAGVVNFILDTTYTGFRIEGQASVFNHFNDTNDKILRANEEIGFLPPRGWSTNGGAQDIAGVFGAEFDDGRGHVTAYATYHTQDPILQSTRDYSFCALGAYAPEYVPDYGTFYCGGSSTSPSGRFITINPITGVDNFTVSGNQFIPGFPLFNYAPYNFFQRPQERYSLGAFAEYEISPAFKPFAELMFMNDRTDAQIAPSGNFGNTSTINCDNPLLSEQQRDLICPAGGTFTDDLGVERGTVIILRRNVEGGGRNDNIEHSAYRIIGGMRGDAARGFAYEAYYQYGRSSLSSVYENDFSVERLENALDVVTDPSTGLPVCRVVLTGEDPDCVPWNIFEEGGVTQEAINYLQVAGLLNGEVQQTIAHADVTFIGDEYGLRMPWAESGLGVNVGAEYRKEYLKISPDINFQEGTLAGQGGQTPPTEGSFDVRELFAEVQLPLVQNNFIDEFLLNAGYRFSNYHVGARSFNTDTYKIAAELAPIADVRFRGSYARAVRAPNVVELFTPQNLGLAGTFDPCAGPNPTATLAQCQLQGVTAAQFGNVPPNPANQYNALFGGNPNLSPEVADTYTAGVVIQPRFIPGLALTADYWSIELEDAIASFGFNTIINQCLETGDPTFCALINRDQFGSLWLTPDAFVQLTQVNVGGIRTNGIDLQGNYSRRLGGLGTVNVAFVGTYLIDLESNPFGDVRYDCASFFGSTCGTPNPKWRHTLRVGLTMPNGLGASVRWRYFSSVRSDFLSEDEDLLCDVGQCLAPGDLKLNAQNYFDLVLTARLAQRLNLRLGANNIFDREPPVASGNVVPAGFGNGNTFPQVYDAMGRFLFAGFTVDF